MDDYIKRQTAMDCLTGIFEDPVSLHEYIAVTLKKLRNAPSADVQPVQCGHWIESDTDGFVCSVCRKGYRNQPTLMGEPMFEYCPVCGARMDGEQNETD